MLITHYKYVYDSQGNIVRSIDVLGEKEYNYSYEDGKLTRATESDITLSGEIVTAKTVIHTICYYYDSDGQMIRKHILPAEGTAQAIYYETSEDNTAVKFYAGGQYVTSHSKSDEFGRKVFDELQLGTGFVSRQFSYHTGEATEEHIENRKLKSSPTTQLVSSIALSDGRTLSYEYDEEERITKVTETFQGENVSVTEYTYDSLGQLLTEKVDGEIVNAMTYDNYGNIVSKNGVAYTYGNTAWKDLLTGYGNKTITYDAQGNPVNYLGHTLTWEKGRQLKQFTKADGTVIDYTYNANGIRTSKTVNGVKHTYTLDGTKILRETWMKDGVIHSIVPMYDNEDSVCGIQYNGEPYYFQKNLQGDIIAIVDKNANTVARYAYDAWGICTITEDNSRCNVSVVNPYRYRGYYFDAEIGIYYVSSRYYDSEIGRFLNIDGPNIIEGGTGISLDYNLATYCFNEPVQGYDPSGMGPVTLVGAGIQIELSIGAASGGLEVVWFISSKVNVGGRNRNVPFIYLYGGASIGPSAKTKKVLKDIIAKPSLLFNPKSLVSGFGLSVCVFAIFGQSNFKSYKSYLEWFSEVYGSVSHVKAYTSWSNSCFTVGAGWSSDFASAGCSQTYYWLSNDVFSGIQNLYNSVVKKAKTLRR